MKKSISMRKSISELEREIRIRKGEIETGHILDYHWKYSIYSFIGAIILVGIITYFIN